MAQGSNLGSRGGHDLRLDELLQGGGEAELLASHRRAKDVRHHVSRVAHRHGRLMPCAPPHPAPSAHACCRASLGIEDVPSQETAQCNWTRDAAETPD